MEIEGTRWWGGRQLLTSIAFIVVTPPWLSDLRGRWRRVVHWWPRLATIGGWFPIINPFSEDWARLKNPLINHFASIVKENCEWTGISRPEVELQGHVNIWHGVGMEIEGTGCWWGGQRLMTSVAFIVVTLPRPSDLSGWWSRFVNWWRRHATIGGWYAGFW